MSDFMLSHQPSLFDGLSSTQLHLVLEHAERLDFPPGAVIIAEGERPGRLYVLENGAVDVFVAGPDGLTQHLVNRLGPGSILGEMSLLTGGTTSATVRASGEVRVISLSDEEIHRAALAVPRLYANLGAIVAHKLVRSDRLPFRAGLERVTLLHDDGAPPILGYALACSLAWFIQGRVLLLVLADRAPDDLASLTMGTDPTGDKRRERGASVRVEAAEGFFAPDALYPTLEEICQEYDHVMVQGAPAWGNVRNRQLIGADRSIQSPVQAGLASVQAWSPGGTGRPDRNGVLRVPRPTGTDLDHLRRGLLPPESAAGRALGWAARDLAGLKLGVALGGGSWRGYAHVGVLRALQRHGIEPDYYAGTSIGSVIAGMSARGDDLEVGTRLMDEAGRSLVRPTLPIRSFLSNRGVAASLRRASGDTRIEDLPTPLAVVATDLNSFSEVVFRRGVLWAAVLASISIPGVWPALRMGPYLLVDGGVLNPVPTSVATAMGADIVLGVRLASPMGSTVEPESIIPEGTGLSAPRAILRSIDMLQTKVNLEVAGAAAIVLDPDLSGITAPSLWNFSEGRAAIERGEAAVEEALPRLEAVLPYLRSARAG